MRRRGDTETAKTLRQQTVYRCMLRHLTVEETAKQLGVSTRTIQRDYRATKDRLMEHTDARALYSLKWAIAEQDEVLRSLWVLFLRPCPGSSLDDRPVKTAILREIAAIVNQKTKLCGPYPQKMIEPTNTTTPHDEGVQIEPPTFDEQLTKGVDELEKNEKLARSEGIEPEDSSKESAA